MPLRMPIPQSDILTSSTPLSEGVSLTAAHILPHADAGSSTCAFSAVSRRSHHLQLSAVSSKESASPKISGESNSIDSPFAYFTTLLQLSSSVHNAFSEAAVASAELRDATTCTGSFRRAIEDIRDKLHETEHIPNCVGNPIASALTSCITALKRVEGRIELQRRRIKNFHGIRAWKGYWATCALEILGGKIELVSLLQRLDDQVIGLRTVLGLLHSTALHNVARRPDIVRANISRVVACIGSLEARVRSPAPIQFFDHMEREVDPLLKMSWGNFVDFWTEHDFPINAADLTHGELFKAQYAEPSPGGLVYFNLFIYADPQSFGTPSALLSPLYFYLTPGDAPQRSYALSRLFLSSATWLAKTLETPISIRAPLIGPRSRQQFVHLETGFPDDIRGSLHTRQYFLDTAPGPPQPEGRLSEVFAYLSRAEELLHEMRRAVEMGDSTGSDWELLVIEHEDALTDTHLTAQSRGSHVPLQS